MDSLNTINPVVFCSVNWHTINFQSYYIAVCVLLAYNIENAFDLTKRESIEICEGYVIFIGLSHFLCQPMLITALNRIFMCVSKTLGDMTMTTCLLSIKHTKHQFIHRNRRILTLVCGNSVIYIIMLQCYQSLTFFAYTIDRILKNTNWL